MMKSTSDIFHLGSLWVLLLAMLALAGCTTTDPRVAGEIAQAADPLTTGETLGALKALNDSEIAQAELALERSDNPEVMETAQLIRRDHQASNRRIDATQPQIELQESDLSRSVRERSDEITEELRELSGTEFDCRFLRHQIELHQAALEVAQTDLVPDNPVAPIEEMLDYTRRMLEQHRESARLNRLEILECEPYEGPRTIL